MAAAAADTLTAKTAGEGTAERAQLRATAADDAARRAAALLDGLEPGEYTVEGRRVTVVVVRNDDRDDSPSLLASAHRVSEWQTPYPLAASSTAASGGRIPASMAAGVLAAVGMLGMLAGVLSLPRSGGLESVAIVRPAEAEEATFPAAPVLADTAVPAPEGDDIVGAASVASAR